MKTHTHKYVHRHAIGGDQSKEMLTIHEDVAQMRCEDEVYSG